MRQERHQQQRLYQEENSYSDFDSIHSDRTYDARAMYTIAYTDPVGDDMFDADAVSDEMAALSVSRSTAQYSWVGFSLISDISW